MRQVLGLLWGGWLLGGTVAAAQEPPAQAPQLRAVRRTSSVKLDGKLDEAAWQDAPVYSEFRQSFPNPDTAPGQRTEVRILHDDDSILFGIIAYDTEPALIDRRLGRRDVPPNSDLVTVFIDPRREGRTGHAFSVTAAGVLKDSLIVEDNQFVDDWDAVWEGAAAQRPDGWSAELRIPLALLRLRDTPVQTWGLGVRRQVARTQEIIDSTFVPLGANALLSRLGALTDFSTPIHPQVLELSPYVATRLIRRPQFSDEARPKPRLSLPSADVGLDLRWSPSRSLDVVGALNPDFSQLEADQLLVNLSNFEVFFPERRPFFTQGMELFHPVMNNEGRTRQLLFYSRRIGLDTPILGAVKVTGSVGDNVVFGVLDSLVAGVADPLKQEALSRGESPDEENPNRDLYFHPRRPLHLGLGEELPAEEPITRNFLAAVGRGRFGGIASVGLSFASSSPFASQACPSEGPSTPEEVSRCRPTGGHAAALDWTVGTASGEWRVLGQLTGSQVTGGSPDGDPLPDGTLLRAGDRGLGTFVRAGLLGGEPFRFSVGHTYASPRLELNRTGYLQAQNEQTADVQLGFVQSAGVGPFEALESQLTLFTRWTTDGREVPLATRAINTLDVTLPGYHALSFTSGYETKRQDVREISGTGIPVELPSHLYLALTGSSDPRRGVVVGFDSFYERFFSRGPSPSQGGAGAELSLTVTAHPQLESFLAVSLSRPAEGSRYLETLGEGRFLFGELEPQYFSLTLRQLWVITPRLTLQGYGQLFHGSVRASAFYEATPEPGQSVRLADLVRTEPELDPDFDFSGVNLNLVLRWEYRPGASFYAVYSRTQNGLPTDAGELSLSPRVLPDGRLWQGPATDLFMLKFSYWWDA
ncbi:carbohydrate binding family 9 domain-containing protein [Hyalangium rubrum]|uniref:DUF5916 domain-containing protein n=1 Tax=Hyalangium rubrum TaxID=3103134 RepID=A0ABU5GVB7_9BACT|nr:DUF5916 domain-containing protein [Hyalangium sp. s54d21]MDY7225123.1 DUF5916 domain-containing protein [Hyalangium sp. s54d21]